MHQKLVGVDFNDRIICVATPKQAGQQIPQIRIGVARFIGERDIGINQAAKLTFGTGGRALGEAASDKASLEITTTWCSVSVSLCRKSYDFRGISHHRKIRK